MMNVSDLIPAVCAAPLVSPLAPEAEDAIGSALQKTTIWTTPDTGSPASSAPVFAAFRKRFTLAGSLHTAHLYLFADVRYLLWINGRYVLRGPARFEPSGPEYDAVDVTRFLKPGENEAAVLVLGQASSGKMRLHQPGLTLRLDADGKTALVSDKTWKWSDQTRYRSPKVDWGNVLDRIDARVEDGDWTQPGYDDRAWKTASAVDGRLWGPLSRRRTPLLRETEIAPRLAGGVTLPVTLGAGQNLTFSTDRLVLAYTLLEIDAAAGTELSLDYAGIHYAARAGHQIYLSSDTHSFYGGTITVQSGRAVIQSLKFVERLYPFDVAGSFHSSDDRLNRLWTLCARSCQVCSEDAYEDCADRERTEWMDNDPPGFDITRTAFRGVSDDGKPVSSDPRLFGALLRRVALTVQPGGWVKAHTASDRFDIHAKMEDRSCDWVEGARRYYDCTGDAGLIREIWPVIVQQMDYFMARRSPRGLVAGRDWEVWGNPTGYVTCEPAGLNAFVYKALVDAAYLGTVIDKKPQAALYARDAHTLAAAFNSVLWNESEGTYYSGYYAENAEAGRPGNLTLKVKNNLIEPTLFPALFALDQGIVPLARHAQVTAYLLEQRAQAKRVMTFYYLFKQLYLCDSPALDAEVLQTMRTKWQGMIDWPWQTTWEEFDGGSHAHIYGAFPGYFLSAYVLGVRPDGPPRNRHLRIEPRLGGLSAAAGTVMTEHGAVQVSWQVHPSDLKFQVEIPAGVSASLRVPSLGENARLTLDGKPPAALRKGRFFALEIGAGIYKGTVSFSPSPEKQRKRKNSEKEE